MSESKCPTVDEQEPDESLLLLARAGDHTAFERLVLRHKNAVIRFADMLLNDRTEAEDIAQDVFIQAFAASKRFRFASKFKTWLFAIARNLCLNELRRRSRHRTEPLVDAGDGEKWHVCRIETVSDRTAPEVFSEREFQQRLGMALASLPKLQRKVLLLLEEEELSYEEMAHLLGISVPATKSLIHRARQTLKHRLQFHSKSEARLETVVRLQPVYEFRVSRPALRPSLVAA